MDTDFWNSRYSAETFVYGTEPNAFVAECSDKIPAGPVLCLAEGEGRNAVYLARLGHEVTAVDISPIGMGKARKLAAAKGVSIRTQVADLAQFNLGLECWSGIVATFAHMPPELRRSVHRRAVDALVPGGVMILEAYSPAQIAFHTGGPRDPVLLMSLVQLREEFAGLELELVREIEREVTEGIGHTGRGAVVQLIGRKPAAG